MGQLMAVPLHDLSSLNSFLLNQMKRIIYEDGPIDSAEDFVPRIFVAKDTMRKMNFSKYEVEIP